MATSGLKLTLPLLACVALFAVTDPAWSSLEPTGATAQVAGDPAGDSVGGRLLGVSKKAKTLTLESAKGPVMLKFDEATAGMENAAGETTLIVKFRMEGNTRLAVDIKPKLATLPEGASEITVPELAALVNNPQADYLLIDSRPAARFAEGHIPSAISIPQERMSELAAAMLPMDHKDKLLVLYCGGVTCGMSPKAAGQAAKMGFTNIKVMLQGVPGWKKSGQPMVADNRFVAEGNLVLIDLRPPEAVAEGHIAGSVNIPLAELVGHEGNFPKSKSAPIVLYGNDNEAKEGAGIIKGWGYKSIALVQDGLAGWQNSGNPLVKGAADDEINWVRSLGADEVSPAGFEKVLTGDDSGRMLLDVRGKDEVVGGRFTGALNIPLDELESRLAELPKDREILAHCTTGARAELAVAILKKYDRKARFLLAEVECEDGDCRIVD